MVEKQQENNKKQGGVGTLPFVKMRAHSQSIIVRPYGKISLVLSSLLLLTDGRTTEKTGFEYLCKRERSVECASHRLCKAGPSLF